MMNMGGRENMETCTRYMGNMDERMSILVYILSTVEKGYRKKDLEFVGSWNVCLFRNFIWFCGGLFVCLTWDWK